MKKTLKSLFIFLGSIQLAIALISIAAISVIIGTLLESKTGSHLYAASWTYENPFFFILLSLFFVNILFSALRRWPFKKKHIPFLITHLGLLMIISGTMIKNRWGLQGQLTVWEGGGNQHLLYPHSHALLVEGKDESSSDAKNLIAFNSFRPKIYYPFHSPSLKCKLIGYAPHVKEELETWIKGPNAYIAGFPSIPVQEWDSSKDFPQATSYRFSISTIFPQWSILALRTSHVKEAIQQAYLQNLMLQLKAGKKTLKIPLKKALHKDFSFMQGNIHAILNLSLLEKDALSSLNLTWSPSLGGFPFLKGMAEDNWTIPLQGQDALLIKPTHHEWAVSLFSLDLIRKKPLICLIEDDRGNTFFLIFDIHGRVHCETFNSSQLQTLMIYEQGFGGYGVQAVVPIPSFPASREDKENAEVYALTMQLQNALDSNPSLTPPLEFLKEACREAQVDFCQTFVQILTEWNAHPSFLYTPDQTIPEPIKQTLRNLKWKNIQDEDQQAILWTVRLMNQLENGWREGEDPIRTLEKHRWPFIDKLKEKNSPSPFSLLNLIAQQIFSLVHDLPRLDFPPELNSMEYGQLLSAYFRIYGIDYRSLLPYQGNGQEQFDHLESYWKEHSGNQAPRKTITFETPLSHRVTPDTAPIKIEDQRPGIVLEIQEGLNKETIALAYDPTNGGLKWPILNGQHLIRYQPNLKKLPYRIRLREARQISYPQSQQVYSYESDLIISENGKKPVEHTLSMNKVYETWDGYRFYLAGIGSSIDGSLKRIQLAVNYDPAKYFLTYPGALLVFLGTVLLFWGKKLFQ